jgi:HPt (histidine-containing phosphotransfer) domain-containing protein
VYAEALLKAAREHDAAALQQAAHSLRGSALLIGARDLADLLAQLERLASRGTTRGAEDIIDKLDAALARTAELLVAAPGGAG